MQKTAEKETPTDDPQRELGRIATADAVLGIPTYNNRETIARVAEAGIGALGNGFSGQRLVIINADGVSRDGTPERLRELVGERVPLLQVRYPVYPVHKLSAPLAGVPGRREAALTIFQYARQLGAKACALVDPEVESIAPEWVQRLIGPVLDGGADLVVPCYLRHKFDGLINNGILSPFARALFGKRLRQPAGADLAFSARLMDYYTGREAADTRSSVDPWSTVPAVCQGFQVGQTFLGPRLVHSREVTLELSGALRQVLTNAFDQMERTAVFWQKVRGSEPVPWFGPPLEMAAAQSEINRKPMLESFRLGCQNLTDVWNLILAPATLLELRRLARQPEEQFRFPDEIWARVIYDFALGYHFRAMGRDHLLEAITPLYLGWAASFTQESQDAGAEEVEGRLERLSLQFEAQKRYLISRWRWPDKFNP